MLLTCCVLMIKRLRNTDVMKCLAPLASKIDLLDDTEGGSLEW